MEENLLYKTKKGFAWKFAEQIATNGMQFVVGVVMARILTPEDFGITALPAVFIAVATALIESGFGLALVRKPELTEKDLSTAFYYSIGLGAFLYLVLFFIAPFIASFYHVPILTDLIRITAITFFIGPLATPQNVILQRNLNFKVLARISITTKILSGVVGVTAAYIGYGLWALVITNLISTIFGFILTLFVVKWIPHERFSKESFRYLWNFGNKMMASTVLNTVYQNIAPLLVGKYFGPTELGVLNRASGYASLPYNQVSGSVQAVSFPVLSKLQEDEDALTRNYNRMIKTVCFLYFPVVILLIGLARPLVIIMLTEKWEACIILLQIECLITIWGPLSALNGNILQVKGRTDLYLKVDLKKKVVGLVLMLATLPFGLIAYCCGRVVAQLYTVYVNLTCVGKILPLGFIKQMKELTSIIILSTIELTSIFLFNMFFENYWIQLFGGGLLGIIVYAYGAYMFKFPEMQDLKYFVSVKK
jgi:O-antigen/teichoic acid export membrane protein